MSKKHQAQLAGHALEITVGVVNAAIIAVKASPFVFVIWLLFIAPNCGN